jgi:ABC-type transport system involved in multi-copper enzyme maturation permease subunit
MTGPITRFEVRYHLRQPLFYILTALFFILTFFAVTSEAVVIGGAVGNVHRNAPYVIMQFLLVMSVFGVLTTTAFVANAVHRDFELGTDALFFSSPMRKAHYLAGRFLGSFTVGAMVYLGVVLAIMIGSFMPWIEKERLGPFALTPYLFSLFVIVVPTLFLIGAIFFSVAALTRSMMATYASVVAFFVAYFVSRAFMRDLENERLGTILDPFGLSAFGLTTRYWTVFQKNTEVLPLEGPFLINRILWIAMALLILGITFWKFDPTTAMRKATKKKAKAADSESLQPAGAAVLPRVRQTFGGWASFGKYLARTRLETKAIVKSIPFIIIVLLGVFNIWGNSTALGRIFGTPVYPVSSVMVTVINNSFSLFAVIIAAFYAGELVFRERTLRLNEVTDSMPLPTWALWTAKLSALGVVSVISIAAAIATAMVIQTAKGYYNYQLDVYAQGLFLDIAPVVVLLAGLAFILQILLNNKYLGFFGMMIYVVLDGVLTSLNFEHKLYSFASTPPGSYSDMNGWGHFVVPRVALLGYWALFIATFLVIGHLLWVRGTDTAMRQRLRIARGRMSGPALAALAVSLAAFVSTGCYIYYNTNVLNDYRTTKDGEKLRASIEKKYKKFENLPQPRITAARADVDLFPDRRAVDIRGTYTLVNKTAKPIGELHVTYNVNALTTFDVTVPGSTVKTDDTESGYRIYTLAQALAPGAATTMTFHTAYAARGFVNGDSNTDVVANGTFINNFSYFPHLGYFDAIELQDRNKRRKYGLGPIERMRPQSDMQARMNNQISRESDWIDLDTTVSTPADQVALAPGYLQRTWTANGRRYFQYKTTSPILGFWSYLSARYTVKRDQWKDIPIEIYYDAKHPYNVDRMIYAIKKSLDYFTANFSPYQHKQVRILEFPRYATFAQSFPNTIPFSEGIGFIADLRDKDEIDYVFYVTAHEVGHQWWAHQVIGGNVQGGTMLVETMAQYSALMVMEKEYGREKMQKFLRYELDRYLRDRGGELVAEMPLSQVENQQYIHYRKGSVAMYALRDYIGEDKVNAALAKFIRDHGFESAPYTTAGELVRYFREVTPPHYQNVVTDLFERIILYDNQAREATATKRADGKYVVKLTVASTKLQSDAKGEEKPIAIDDWVDIGVFAAGKKEDLGKPLFMEKRRITRPSETFEIVVGEKPARAGIDPYHKLIDRNPKDNTKSL